MLSLRYRTHWIAASIVLLLVVMWGSLQSSVSTPTPQGFDKFEHFGTYLFLAVWFTGLYRRPQYGAVAASLLALGLTMEVAQFLMDAGRMGDPRDMIANAAGVGVGLALALMLTGGWAERIEAWLK